MVKFYGLLNTNAGKYSETFLRINYNNLYKRKYHNQIREKWQNLVKKSFYLLNQLSITQDPLK